MDETFKEEFEIIKDDMATMRKDVRMLKHHEFSKANSVTVTELAERLTNDYELKQEAK